MGDNMTDYNQYLSWLEETFDRYSQGKAIYDVCVNVLKESPGAELIVSPANLGDTVFIGTLAKQYKKTHNVDTLLIAAKQRQADAVEWFDGVDAVMPLEDYEMICLRHYFIISRKFYENGIRYGHIPCYVDWNIPNNFLHIEPGFRGDSLINVWKKRILDLPDDSELGGIIVPPNNGIVVCPAKYGNAVLIAPAAFTNKGIPETFWEKLVAKLNEKGIEVYCNSGGLSYDKIIKGTKECRMSTRELILNAPLFKHVIGVRSGFTDLVTKTSARLTVLHLGGTMDSPLYIEYGSGNDDVRDLGRVEDIFPYKYCAEREDELIDLILQDVK